MNVSPGVGYQILVSTSESVLLNSGMKQLGLNVMFRGILEIAVYDSTRLMIPQVTAGT